MPSFMVGASDNNAGGRVSEPFPRSPHGPWDLQQDEGNTPLGPSTSQPLASIDANALVQQALNPSDRCEVKLPYTR